MLKLAPKLQNLIFGKTYILPNYRQVDYYPQAWGNELYHGTLIEAVVLGLRDDVANAGLCNALRAMDCGRPQLWLERELAEAFLRSHLPTDMSTDDVKWRWPGLRVHLPKRILRVAPINQTQHDLMYMDICCVPLKQVLTVPEPYASEISALTSKTKPGAVYATMTTPYAQTALMITGNLSSETTPYTVTYEQAESGNFMIYGVIKPFDTVTLGEIAKVVGVDEHLASPYAPTGDDDKFCEKILHLGLNILLYLGSMPLEYEAATILRKAHVEGKHPIPALLRAKFVGQSQLRAQPAHTAEPVHHTGRHLPVHWKCGHWKRQVHGVARAERKLIWIQPYQTHGFEEDEIETPVHRTHGTGAH